MNYNEERLALCARIRKPKNKLKYRCKAHRSMAIKSLDRLLRIDGRLHWVELNRDFDKLVKLLNRMSSDDWAQLPRNRKGEWKSRLLLRREVTRSSLNELNHSISKWSMWLDSAGKRKQSESLTKQQSELRSVVARQQFLFSPTAESSQSRELVLDRNQTLEFEALFAKVQYVSAVWNPAMRNLAKFVYWCGGSVAFNRFATAMNRVPKSFVKYCKQLDRAISWTESLQKRMRSESKLSVSHDLDSNGLNQELHEWMELRNLKHTIKGKLAHRLKNARDNYVSARRLVSVKIERTLPVTIAAWAICSKSGDELPQYHIDRAFEIESPKENALADFASQQIELSQSDTYPRLVQFMNQYGLVYSFPSCLRWILGCLEKANQFNDIKYLLDDGLAEFATVKLRQIGKASQRYKSVFAAQRKEEQYSDLIGCAEDLYPVEAVDKVMRWLEMFPPKLFTRGLSERIHGVLKTLVQLADVKPMQSEIDAILTTWSSRSHQIRDCFPDESALPRELRSWLRRLAYFQRMSDSEVRIPSSLVKVLEGPRREARELVHLQRLEREDQLNHKQLCRLNSLLSKSRSNRGVNEKAILLTMELCVLSAIESLRKLLMKPVQNVWVKIAGGEMLSSWSDQRCVEYANWTLGMKPSEKQFFRTTFAAYRQYGPAAKSHLPFNQKWIDQQRSLGFSVDVWLDSTSESFSIGKETFQVGICNDPNQVLLMGTLFNTCLSPGGCNEMAVLANLADANKQVLYVWNNQNKIVARKLLSVSRTNGLIGYDYYRQAVEIDGENRDDEISNFVSAFCGRLAARVGWKLVDLGEPLSLGHFWYDDGEVDWPKAAKDAFCALDNGPVSAHVTSSVRSASSCNPDT